MGPKDYVTRAVDVIEDFDTKCEATEYTDTGELWDTVIPLVRGALGSASRALDVQQGLLVALEWSARDVDDDERCPRCGGGKDAWYSSVTDLSVAYGPDRTRRVLRGGGHEGGCELALVLANSGHEVRYA